MKRAFGIAFGAILSFGLAQDQPGWEVSGAVTTDSGPVKGAYVNIRGASGIPGAQTDGQGRYSLKGVAPGRYSVSVEKKDNTSAPRSRSLTLAAGVRLRVDFRIPKGAVISGRVLDRDRQPVQGVIVRTFSKAIVDGRLRLTEQGGDKTNDLGEYRVPYLPEGAYVVAATSLLQIRKGTPGSNRAPREGYSPNTFYPGTRALDSAAVLEVRSGDERPGVDIVLQKQATRCVSFTVGSALAGPNIFARLEDRLAANAPSVAEGAVTANGSYEICGLAPGEYRLHLSSITPGPPMQWVGYQMAVAAVDKENVDLGSLESLASGDVRGTVIVKDASTGGSMPAGIRVRIVARELQALYANTGPGLVQPDGTFVLHQVFMGDYGIRVDALPAGYYLIGASQQGRNVWDSGLMPGDGDVRITMGKDGAVVSGRVLAEDGAAIPDASVFLVPKDSGQHLVAQSDQTGAYRFTSGVQPGQYRLVAAADLAGWQRQDAATVARLAANGTELKVGPQESRAVDLKIQSTR
jgi:hypothetical protein